jgi:hypothetical protein
VSELRLQGAGRIPPPRNILLSYWYYKRIDIEKFSSCNIVADSGAFSARTLGKTISTTQLVAWVNKWEHLLSWVAALDVPSIEQTKRNWQRMCDLGIPGVSTIHAGDPPETMDWYAEQGVDFLGLGGVAGQPWPPSATFRWLVSVFKYARDNHPQMRFHGWGMTHRDWMRLPFFSVDSSGWGQAYRYGRIMLRDPVTGESIGVDLDGGKGVYKPRVAQLLKDYYGVLPSEIAKSGPKNRVLLVRLSALSASVQEEQWRKTFRNKPVTPPQWGRLKGWSLGDGPVQHLAMSGCGAGIRERKVFEEFYGPHLHLVDGFSPHMKLVADLAAGKELKAGDYGDPSTEGKV